VIVNGSQLGLAVISFVMMDGRCSIDALGAKDIDGWDWVCIYMPGGIAILLSSIRYLPSSNTISYTFNE